MKPTVDEQGKCGWFHQWEYLSSTNPSSPGRKGVLANIIECYIPSLL